MTSEEEFYQSLQMVRLLLHTHTHTPSNTLIRRGFMPQTNFVSCYLCVAVTCLQGVWSRVALSLRHFRPATVFAWLPHFELMRLSKTPPEKHARSAARSRANAIKQLSPPSILSVSQCTDTNAQWEFS